jgi:hypothetical protein
VSQVAVGAGSVVGSGSAMGVSVLVGSGLVVAGRGVVVAGGVVGDVVDGPVVAVEVAVPPDEEPALGASPAAQPDAPNISASATRGARETKRPRCMLIF